jgi:hypothetical protein
VGRHLEEVCQRWVTWESRRATWSFDTLAGWAVSSGHLIEDGAARASAVLGRIAEGDMLARVELTTTGDRGQRLRRRTLRLTGVVVALTALVALNEGAPRFGMNVFTVEAALVGSALLVLVNSIRMLALAD